MACKLLFAIMINSISSSAVRTIFPPLQKVQFENVVPTPVSMNFEVAFSFLSENPVWTRKFQRSVFPAVQRLRESTTNAGGVSSLLIEYVGEVGASEYPTISTDESYQISWTAESIRISASSLSGIVYGLGTLAQYMYTDGTLPAEFGEIRDYPNYVHRGLLVDTGRRFWPLSFLKQTIEAMSAVKLNVLHFHFSDNCRFAIRSDSHPELRPSDGQLLRKSEVKTLIKYAASRGIRVVPEIDLPGHARGMRNGKDVSWFNADRVQMTDSPGTRAFLKDILEEFADLFPDEYFHIGADETQNAPKDLIEYAIGILKAKGKKVVGWEEMFFHTGAGEGDDVTIQLWKDFKVAQTDNAGFKSIFSHYQSLYLDLRPENRKLWLDINKDGSANLLGSEVAMWTDNFCPIGDCYVIERPIPIAGKWYTSAHDGEFTDAINRLVWTKTGLAASSFWNYDTKIDLKKFDLKFLKNFLYTNFAIKGCVDVDDTCRCSELKGCGAVDWFTTLPLRWPLTPNPASAEDTDQNEETFNELQQFQVDDDGTVDLSVSSSSVVGSMIVPLSYPVVITADAHAPAAIQEHIGERVMAAAFTSDIFDGGIFLTKFASYLGPKAMKRFEVGIPTGDVSIYYVDAFYSAPAFAVESRPSLESFLVNLRPNLSPASTVYFVYDDGAKYDPFLFSEYLDSFESWLNSMDPGTKQVVGSIGIGLNIEDLRVEQISPILSRELPFKFQIVVYHEPSPSMVAFALRKADSLLVHVPGKTTKAIVSNILSFLKENALGKLGHKVTFAVPSLDMDAIAAGIRAAYEGFFPKLLMVHPYERIVAALH